MVGAAASGVRKGTAGAWSVMQPALLQMALPLVLQSHNLLPLLPLLFWFNICVMAMLEPLYTTCHITDNRDNSCPGGFLPLTAIFL